MASDITEVGETPAAAMISVGLGSSWSALPLPPGAPKAMWKTWTSTSGAPGSLRTAELVACTQGLERHFVEDLLGVEQRLDLG